MICVLCVNDVMIFFFLGGGGGGNKVEFGCGCFLMNLSPFFIGLYLYHSYMEGFVIGIRFRVSSELNWI